MPRNKGFAETMLAGRSGYREFDSKNGWSCGLGAFQSERKWGESSPAGLHLYWYRNKVEFPVDRWGDSGPK